MPEQLFSTHFFFACCFIYLYLLLILLLLLLFSLLLGCRSPLHLRTHSHSHSLKARGWAGQAACASYSFSFSASVSVFGFLVLVSPRSIALQLTYSLLAIFSRIRNCSAFAAAYLSFAHIWRQCVLVLNEFRLRLTSYAKHVRKWAKKKSISAQGSNGGGSLLRPLRVLWRDGCFWQRKHALAANGREGGGGRAVRWAFFLCVPFCFILRASVSMCRLIVFVYVLVFVCVSDLVGGHFTHSLWFSRR